MNIRLGEIYKHKHHDIYVVPYKYSDDEVDIYYRRLDNWEEEYKTMLIWFNRSFDIADIKL